MLWLTALIHRAFGEKATVDHELIAFFVGPLGLGALASACYEFAAADSASPVVSTAVFGGVTVLSFGC